MKTLIVEGENGHFTMTRHGRDIREMDRSFDIEFWQRQGDKAIFNAAWELVKFHARQQGITDLSLHKKTGHFSAG